MFHRISMNVTEPRKIRPLVSKSRLAEIEPHLSFRGTIQLVDPTRRFDMQDAQHITQGCGVGSGRRRVSNEMVVIREPRPRLQLPTKCFGHSQQAPV
jgi:hypothetical protein